MNNITITQEWTTQLVKVRVMKKIPVKVYEELKTAPATIAKLQILNAITKLDLLNEIEWADCYGINTPYVVSYV